LILDFGSTFSTKNTNNTQEGEEQEDSALPKLRYVFISITLFFFILLNTILHSKIPDMIKE